jgi:hypothetical protein
MYQNRIMNSLTRILNRKWPPLIPDFGKSSYLPGLDQFSRVSILAIDASISMLSDDWIPSRLDAAKDSAKTFLRRLISEEPDAATAVIAYGDDAVLLVYLTPVTMYDKILQSIDSITTMGSTNITAALEIAYDILRVSHSQNQFVLLSDGFHNTGPDPRPISVALRKHAVVECVGIGGSPEDVDEDLLRYIATSYSDGTKRYRWIGDKERLEKHFHNLAGRIARA